MKNTLPISTKLEFSFKTSLSSYLSLQPNAMDSVFANMERCQKCKKHNQTMRALMKPNQEKKVNFLSVKTQFQNDKYTSLPNDNNLYVILTGTYCIAKPLAFTDVNLLVQYYNILAERWNRKKRLKTRGVTT